MLGFTEKEIISSHDGIGHTDVKHVVSTNESNIQSNITSLSLHQQLARNKEIQDAKWKEEHNPNKPPAGYNEEDVEFIKNQMKKEKEKESAIVQLDIDAQQEYEKSMLQKKLTKVIKRPSVKLPSWEENTTNTEEFDKTTTELPTITVVTKRKEPTKNNNSKDDDDDSGIINNNNMNKRSKVVTSALSLLDYGSSSSSDEE